MSPEFRPAAPLPSASETLPFTDRGREELPSREIATGAGQGDATTFAQAAAATAVPIQPVAIQDETQPAGAVPLVAADDDLIEKSWVEKAKNIVAETKNDPYEQEREVSKLQASYLFKRYGKEIKTAKD